MSLEAGNLDSGMDENGGGSGPVRRERGPDGRVRVERSQAGGAASVLLVDSDIPFREELAQALSRVKLAITWRARRAGLLEAVAAADPLAVVLGADAPLGDPLEVLRSIRESSIAGELPVFLVADDPGRQLELQAYALGADRVLRRSESVGELTARLLGLSHRRRARRLRRAREVADEAITLVRAAADAGGPGGSADAARWRPTPHARGEGGSGPRVDLSPSSPPPPEPAPEPEPRYETASPCGSGPPSVPDVIVIEDDKALLEMLEYALRNRGYSIHAFSNGLEALAALRKLETGDKRPVVLLDVDLPGLDGFRVLQEIGLARPGAYQVILCTVHSSEAAQVLGIQSGAIDYLVKPLRMPIVLAKVERLVGAPALDRADVHPLRAIS